MKILMLKQNKLLNIKVITQMLKEYTEMIHLRRSLQGVNSKEYLQMNLKRLLQKMKLKKNKMINNKIWFKIKLWKST